MQILQALLIAYNSALACFFFSHHSVVSVATCSTTLALAAATAYVCSRGFGNVRSECCPSRPAVGSRTAELPYFGSGHPFRICCPLDLLFQPAQSAAPHSITHALQARKIASTAAAYTVDQVAEMQSGFKTARSPSRLPPLLPL